MSDSSLPIAPVVFMIFNRPDVTRRVFEEIRKAKPRKLFIIADGPRNKEESARCEATRAIVDRIDWECDVCRNYSESNLGCKDRISSGITWVFNQVEEAIFLEDDCLPHPDFFTFCTAMLERYRNDERVMHVSGDNFQQKNPSYVLTDSYYFSRIPHVWGWATWRRAWSLYDPDLKNWPIVQENKALAKALPDPSVRLHWEHVFAQYYAKTISSWDGQWVFCCLIHEGLCIMPRVNLIKNIGFGSDATHATDASFPFANLPVSALPPPYTYMGEIVENTGFDSYTYRIVYGIDRRLYQKAISFLRNYFPGTYAEIRKYYRAVRTTIKS